METIEVPASAAGEIDFVELMLAEHGPTGAILALILFALWKYGLPVLRQVALNAQALFVQHLEQGKETNERLAKLETAVTRGDEHNRAAIAALRSSMDSALATATTRIEKHDRDIEALRTGHSEHEVRIRGLEHHSGLSGAWRRPPTIPPQSHD